MKDETMVNDDGWNADERAALLATPEGLYWWVRSEDETGMSGTGRVAQVAVFEDRSAVLRWLRGRNAARVGSTVAYDSVADLVWVHGHGRRSTGRLERAQQGDPGLLRSRLGATHAALNTLVGFVWSERGYRDYYASQHAVRVINDNRSTLQGLGMDLPRSANLPERAS